MTKFVVCFSGRIASGKTTVSRTFAQRAGTALMSFGDYVRSEARARNLDECDRRVLQELGEALINEHGWIDFCRNALALSGWDGSSSLTVDGIRHAEAYAALRRLVAPLRTRLVYLEVSDETVENRRVVRGLDNSPSGNETHSTEIQVVGSLSQMADVVLKSDRPLTETLDSLSKHFAF
jgi:cytidylate kinase